MCTNLLNLIINPCGAKQICFLCLKQEEQLQDIHLDLVIVGTDLEFTVSVHKMMADLFPYHDPLLPQVCIECSNVIINIYTVMHRYNLRKEQLMNIAQSIEKAISNVKASDQKCYLNCSMDQSVNNSNTNSDQECPKCTMKFESKILLQEHNGIAHKSADKALLCHSCGKVCKTPQALKDHLNCHSEKQCPYCSKMLKTYSYYKKHVRSHESMTKQKRSRSYKCNECTFVSFNKSSLDAHINKVHLRIRPHSCPICFKGFFKKSNLTDHVRIHEKVRTETCEICGDSFACKKSLTWHLRLHSNETPYECDVCLKKFVTSGRRLEHVKRKHMEKTECCSFCHKMFSLKRELNRHVKMYHLDKDATKNVEHTGDCGNTEILVAIKN